MTPTLDPLVLIVEDDPDISALMARYLDDNGFATAVARDGAAMHHFMATRRPDLIVLDINLPGEDGLSLCLKLRNADGPRIIMVTARGEDIDRILGLRDGSRRLPPEAVQSARTAGPHPRGAAASDQRVGLGGPVPRDAVQRLAHRPGITPLGLTPRGRGSH